MLVATQGPDSGHDRLRAATLAAAPAPTQATLDPLAPARGILLGSALGACLWLPLVLATWLLSS